MSETEVYFSIISLALKENLKERYGYSCIYIEQVVRTRLEMLMQMKKETKTDQTLHRDFSLSIVNCVCSVQVYCQVSHKEVVDWKSIACCVVAICYFTDGKSRQVLSVVRCGLRLHLLPTASPSGW